MSNELWSTHIQRLKAGASRERTLAETPEWLERNTFMNGKPFSFSGHRYQLDILRDKSASIVGIKPSQVGFSELIARMILARAAIIEPYHVIYAMPSAKASQDFCKGRVSTIIDESPYLRQLVDKNNDSVTMKKLKFNLIHFKGAFKDAQSISTVADLVVADEYAFCDTTIVKQFNSRLTHSKHKHFILFSTPTLPGVSIDAEFNETRRHRRLCKCIHCNDWFWPQFLDHCRIPGHEVDWLSIGRKDLMDLPWAKTAIFCPKCGKEPDLSHEYRQWVCENPTSNFLGAGYAVTPFDVPSIIKAPYLAEKSVAYARKTDWLNVNLGLASEDKESTILRSELEDIMVDAAGGFGAMVMGLDLGMICHAVIGMVAPDGLLVIIHTEQIPVTNLVERYQQLKREWNVRISVADFYPYSETILRMQNFDQNLFAAIYVNTRSTEPFSIKKVEDDPDKGKQEVRRVSINRDVAFDMQMYAVRSKTLLKKRDKNDELWTRHMLSMKRVRAFGPNDEMVFQWEKTDGEDHFAHAGIYCLAASKMIAMTSSYGGALPLLSTFKLKPPES